MTAQANPQDRDHGDHDARRLLPQSRVDEEPVDAEFLADVLELRAAAKEKLERDWRPVDELMNDFRRKYGNV